MILKKGLRLKQTNYFIFKECFFDGFVPYRQVDSPQKQLFYKKQVLMYQVVPRINCINESIVLTDYLY